MKKLFIALGLTGVLYALYRYLRPHITLSSIDWGGKSFSVKTSVWGQFKTFNYTYGQIDAATTQSSITNGGAANESLEVKGIEQALSSGYSIYSFTDSGKVYVSLVKNNIQQSLIKIDFGTQQTSTTMTENANRALNIASGGKIACQKSIGSLRPCGAQQ